MSNKSIIVDSVLNAFCAYCINLPCLKAVRNGEIKGRKALCVACSSFCQWTGLSLLWRFDVDQRVSYCEMDSSGRGWLHEKEVRHDAKTLHEMKEAGSCQCPKNNRKLVTISCFLQCQCWHKWRWPIHLYLPHCRTMKPDTFGIWALHLDQAVEPEN